MLTPAELLECLSLGKHLPTFERASVDATSLLELDDAKLRDLGVQKEGERKGILSVWPKTRNVLAASNLGRHLSSNVV